MSDSSSLELPNNTALTSDLMYNLKPSGARAKSYRASIMPTNKTVFAASDSLIIYCPCGRRGTYLNAGSSYMRYTVKNMDATNGMYFDGNGSSIIQRIDVFHGSNLLESIIGYNMLVNYILDVQASTSQRQGLANIYGFDSTGDRSGYLIPALGQITICMPLFSGVIGLLASKNLPLGFLNDDIRVEITFESAQVAFAAAAGTPTYNVIDFQLELDIIELSDEAESMVRSIADPATEPIYIHGSSWKRYTSSLAASTSGTFSTLVPARFASLKQLALLPIIGSHFTSATSYSIGSRVNPAIDSYFFRIGAAIIPNKPVVLQNANNTGGFGEAFSEMLKSWHSLHSTANSTCLDLEYNVNDVAITRTNVAAFFTAANSYKNGFCIAQELESFPQRSDVLLSGMNTLSSQVFFEANLNATAPANAYNMNFFAWYDHIIVIQNGIMSIKF